MYHISQKNRIFTKTNFFAWQLLGLFQGVICMLVTIYSIGGASDVSGVDSYGIGFYLV
jgi:magnesium-transporting ATPase (P-type)